MALNLPSPNPRIIRHERALWQRRFWEHTISDQADFNQHLDYIHYNPVKHGLVSCPHAWPHSSFSRWVNHAAYDATWQCTCNDPHPPPLNLAKLDARSE